MSSDRAWEVVLMCEQHGEVAVREVGPEGAADSLRFQIVADELALRHRVEQACQSMTEGRLRSRFA